MDAQTWSLIKKVSPYHGTFLGVLWSLSFIFIMQLFDSPMLYLIGLGIALGSLMCCCTFSYRFRWQNCHGKLGFAAQWLEMGMMMMYGCILMAVIVYIYIQFFDRYAYVDFFKEMIAGQEALFDELMEGTGFTSDSYLAEIEGMSPITYVMSQMQSNILMCLMASPILTLLARIKFGKRIERTIN